MSGAAILLSSLEKFIYVSFIFSARMSASAIYILDVKGKVRQKVLLDFFDYAR